MMSIQTINYSRIKTIGFALPLILSAFGWIHCSHDQNSDRSLFALINPPQETGRDVSTDALISGPGNIDRINLSISLSKRCVVLDSSTSTEPRTMIAGAGYLLRCSTKGLQKMTNQLILFHGAPNDQTRRLRLVEFYIDKNQATLADIQVNPTQDLEWTFTMPDSTLIYDRGYLELFAQFQVQGSNYGANQLTDFFELDDPSPEIVATLNDSSPVLTVKPSIQYAGDQKTEAEISALIDEMKARFLFATKGYIAMEPTYAGRVSLPSNGDVSGNPPFLHDYLAWWNSMPHNLAGTTLQPLDPANPKDQKMIRLAWYAEDGNQQNAKIRNDIEASLPGYQAIALADYVGGSSSAWNNVAIAGLYNSAQFKQYANGAFQYGMPQDLKWETFDHQLHIALHEYGHTLGLGHTGIDAYPEFGNLPAMLVKKTDLSMYTQIMSQGVLQDYPTDRFFTDKNIGYMTAWVVGPNNFATLPIPDVLPPGTPLVSATVVLRGKKESGAGLLVNDTQVLPVGDSNTTFSVPLTMIPGDNRFDVAQVMTVNGTLRRSHPNIVYTTYKPEILSSLPALPSISFAKLPLTVNTPEKTSPFTLNASAANGLSKITWWIEMLAESPTSSIFHTTYVYRPVSNMTYTRTINGSASVMQDYRVSLKDPGQYKLRARAWDAAGNATGIIETNITITAP